MAYVQLPVVEVEVAELQLDLDNYRIPVKPEDEAGALRYLFASEDVMGAAESILRDGYFDNEVPIVLEEPPGSRRYLVLEGNRRVSALKALQDPDLVVGYREHVERLRKRFASEVPNLPSRIRVMVIPDRQTAAPHIARLHTTASKRPWTPDQQATFYYSLLDDSTTVAEVKAQYPGVKKISRFMKMASMRRFLDGVRFTDHSLHEYAVSNELKMSVFEYAYSKPGIAAAIGVRFTKDGLLDPVTKKPEDIGRDLSEQQRQAVEYLLGGFRAKRLTTRSPEFQVRDPSHAELVTKLTRTPKEVPVSVAPGEVLSSGTTSLASPKQRVTISSSSSSSPAASAPAATPASAPGDSGVRGPDRPDTKNKLDLTGLSYDQVPVNLKERYIELRRLSLSDFPITTAILLRSILETTVKLHLESKNLSPSGALKEVLKQLADAYPKDRALKTSLNPISSGNDQKPGSVRWFNLVAHSPDKPVSSGDVREAWKLVEPLLRRLLPSRESGNS